MQKRNRMYPKKYLEYTNRGFDIFTNRKFDDPDHKMTIHKPQVPDKPTAWDVIEYQKTLSKPRSAADFQIPRKNSNAVSTGSQKDEEPKLALTTRINQHTNSNWGGPQTTKNEGVPSRTVLSNVAAENVVPQSHHSSRSIRTGGFQKVPVNL